jgi:hypothetical protein
MEVCAACEEGPGPGGHPYGALFIGLGSSALGGSIAAAACEACRAGSGGGVGSLGGCEWATGCRPAFLHLWH